jgi:hypothetical protein
MTGSTNHLEKLDPGQLILIMICWFLLWKHGAWELSQEPADQ